MKLHRKPGISRRQFLRRAGPATGLAALGLPTVIPSSVFGADPAIVPSKRVNLGWVLSRKECIAPAETAHRSITIAHLGNIAMLTGRDIKWDPVRERIIGDPEASKRLTREYRPPWILPV